MLAGSYEGEALGETHGGSHICQRHRVVRRTAGNHERSGVNRCEVTHPQCIFAVAQHTPTVDFCLADEPVVRDPLGQGHTRIERQIDVEFVRTIGTDRYGRWAAYLNTGVSLLRDALHCEEPRVSSEVRQLDGARTNEGYHWIEAAERYPARTCVARQRLSAVDAYNTHTLAGEIGIYERVPGH